MQLAFSWWQLFDVLLSILWLISGVRDFMGKDPLIRLPFNQYERDPEYRAFWQKKNGVFYMLNSIAFLILTFIPVTSLIYRIIFGIAIVGDLLYLVAYEAWEHSADGPAGKGGCHEPASFRLGVAACRHLFAVHLARHPGSA